MWSPGLQHTGSEVCISHALSPGYLISWAVFKGSAKKVRSRNGCVEWSCVEKGLTKRQGSLDVAFRRRNDLEHNTEAFQPLLRYCVHAPAAWVSPLVAHTSRHTMATLCDTDIPQMHNSHHPLTYNLPITNTHGMSLPCDIITLISGHSTSVHRLARLADTPHPLQAVACLSLQSYIASHEEHIGHTNAHVSSN